MEAILHRWLRAALVSLGVLVAVGVILRYKIAFSLPFFDQKKLLHGHSHFAFAGWITQALMTLMVAYLHNRGLQNSFKKYAWVLAANLIAAYGMLFSFPVQGYGPVSVAFSTLSVAISYCFAFMFRKDLNVLLPRKTEHRWFRAAILFNVLSSVGTFALAIMMMRHGHDQKIYLSSVYYYLHFQYNGWFFFGCGGLLMTMLRLPEAENVALRRIFRLFFFACFPAYLLSVLWMDLPIWLHVIIVLAALAQFMAWIWLVRILFRHRSVVAAAIIPFGRVLLGLAAIALSVKLMLQLGSTYSPLSDLAFGFRPIVIGYLHLVLLGVITLFLLGFMYSGKIIQRNKWSNAGILIFVAGIFFTEFLLMYQGIEALENESVPYINEYLLSVAVWMLAGIGLLITGQFSSPRERHN